jgi:membrane-bound inhibitor of C-type lysozyme
MKDGSDVVLDILYPGHITLNRKAEYRCHDSNLTVQIYDICESYVDLIRAASKPILEK